jgi:hypothetical protein
VTAAGLHVVHAIMAPELVCEVWAAQVHAQTGGRGSNNMFGSDDVLSC